MLTHASRETSHIKRRREYIGLRGGGGGALPAAGIPSTALAHHPAHSTASSHSQAGIGKTVLLSVRSPVETTHAHTRARTHTHTHTHTHTVQDELML